MALRQGIATAARMMRTRVGPSRRLLDFIGSTGRWSRALMYSPWPPPLRRRPAQPRQPRPVDPWKGDDWRWKDDVGPIDLVELPELPELGLDQALPARIPAAMLERPALEPWRGPESPLASGPRKITAEVLTRAVELHQAGMSWPAIAREFSCHRMAFYHALRRPQS